MTSSTCSTSGSSGSRRLRPPGVRAQSVGPRPRPSLLPTETGEPQWPTFTGSAVVVGTSASGVTVYVDPALGADGLQNAQGLLEAADGIVAANNRLFNTTGGPVAVIVYAMDGKTDGTGGADHGGCDFDTGRDIEVCASFGSSARVGALFEAELSECCMGGNLCGYSTGEALSQWCAAVVSANALSDYATAPEWERQGAPDWVTKTEHTDGDPVSVGCGMAFISWLMSQGHALDQVAQAMVALGENGTLAQLYARLTGRAAQYAWPSFIAAVQALPRGVTTDDPFDGAPAV